MARDHGRILTSIWNDPDFQALGPEAQRLYMLFVSHKSVNHAGVLPLMPTKWAKASKHTTVADIEKALAELADAHYVVVDDDTEEVLVRSFIRNDGVWKHPNSRKAAVSAARATESPRLKASLATEIRKLGAEDVASEIEPDEIPSVSHPDAIPMPSGTRLDPSGEGEGVGTKSSPSPSKVVEKRSPRSQTKRGTRIPDDFTVTPEMTKWARERVPELAGRNETEKFVNYWRAKSGKDATKVDWVATWRNWMLTAAERVPSRASPTPTGDARVAALQARKHSIAALPGGAP